MYGSGREFEIDKILIAPLPLSGWDRSKREISKISLQLTRLAV